MQTHKIFPQLIKLLLLTPTQIKLLLTKYLKLHNSDEVIHTLVIFIIKYVSVEEADKNSAFILGKYGRERIFI